MKNIGILIVLSIVFLGFVSAGSMGSVWTTTNGCGEPSKNVNHYEVGEQIYLNGVGFYKDGEYEWAVRGNNGGSSCDSGKIVATGILPLYEEESFCFPVYTVQEGDCGTYKVKFGMKVDSYRVKPQWYSVPEFKPLIGILTVLGALGVFFVVRRR